MENDARFGAHFVEVEVDTRVGSTKILKYTAVHESGRIINPTTARDQIRGATIQGIGRQFMRIFL